MFANMMAALVGVPMPAVGSGTGGAPAPEPSASETVAKEVSGSHVLTITGYSITKRVAYGEFIGSSPFAAAGHRWRVLYYPDGLRNAQSPNPGWPGNIAIYLELHPTGDPNVKARFTISLLDENGEPVPRYTQRNNKWPNYSSMGVRTGIDRFVWAATLEDSGHIRDDRFRLRCDITVLKVVHREDARRPTRFVVVPPSSMDQDLGRLLSSGKGADIAFEVAGETFAAHRSILATRSPVFMAEFFGGPMKEQAATRVHIDDMEARVFRALLHFLYTDSLPEIDQGETMAMSQHLLVAADRYSLERLKLICEDNLCNYIETGTVGAILTLAEQHGCHGLKKACFEFLMSGKNLKAAIQTDGFDHLTNSCPSVLKELLFKAGPM